MSSDSVDSSLVGWLANTNSVEFLAQLANAKSNHEERESHKSCSHGMFEHALTPLSQPNISYPRKDGTHRKPFSFVEQSGKRQPVAREGTPPRSPTNSVGAVAQHSPRRKGVHTRQRDSDTWKIKRFYFGPLGIPTTQQDTRQGLAKIEQSFTNDSFSREEFRSITTDVCKLPLSCNSLLFDAVAAGGERAQKQEFIRMWCEQLGHTQEPSIRLFNLLRQPDADTLVKADFAPLVQYAVDEHRGLQFLADAPNFHRHYIDTVIGRMFYHINRHADGHMTLTELKNSNLLDVLFLLDEEEDINEIFDYFSYEHFYVIYCKFWELDTNHDFLITAADLAQYAERSLTERVIERIMDGVPRKLHGEKPRSMTYEDFMAFILSEEDKKSVVSIEYWFRVLDLDGDGVLSAFELHHFFEQQAERIRKISTEAISFSDFLCQLNDMISPEVTSFFTLRDLKRSKMSHLFFDMLFNLNKYALHEQRDPYVLEEIRSTPHMTDWDRFASAEYLRYAEEDGHV